MTKKLNEVDITEIEQDYYPYFDIFTEEQNKTYRLKYIVANQLSEVERRIILLYAELGSQREVAAKLGVSLATINIYITAIRKKIKELL